MCAVSFRSRLAETVYEFLDIGKSPRPADCIFVLAGRQEPQTHGINMWRFGYAPQLIQSEDITRKPSRKARPGIRSEARILAEHLRDKPVRSLLVVSSPMHLRRAALAFRRAFRKSGIELTFVAVPEKPAFSSEAVRAEVWSEFRRYLLSRLLML